MKKILYGTTAIVTASMLGAGAASAAEPITLSVGGYYTSVFAVTDADETTETSYQPAKFEQEGEIHFRGETTLDNGLQVGIQVQLEAFSTDDQIDEHFVYLEGGWGRLEIGAENGAAFKAGGSGVPTAIVGHGVDSPTFSHHPEEGEAHTSTQIDTSGDANKITYYTPRLSGFQLGVSYTPDAGTPEVSLAPGSGGSGTGPLVENDALENVIEVGANWSGSFSDVDLGINAGYLTGDPEPNENDPNEWRVGASVGIAGFTIAGNYNDQELQRLYDGADVDVQSYSVGVSYGTGPWQVAAGYLHSDLSRPDDERDHYEIGASYVLGPGVTISGGFQYYETSHESTTGVEETYESTSGIIALGLNF